MGLAISSKESATGVCHFCRSFYTLHLHFCITPSIMSTYNTLTRPIQEPLVNMRSKFHSFPPLKGKCIHWPEIVVFKPSFVGICCIQVGINSTSSLRPPRFCLFPRFFPVNVRYIFKSSLAQALLRPFPPPFLSPPLSFSD